MMKYAVMSVAIVLLLSVSVTANVVISQILYDPIGTESGGEAIELKNVGSSIVDLSNWVIATEASATDVKIPQGKFIEPGRTFLIADVGWSTKRDDLDWKEADVEDTMTMANSNSGIALKDSNGNIVDAVGWGDEAEIKPDLWEGTPAQMVSEGNVLLRTQDTNDNSEDFVEASPNFFDGVPVFIEADVSIVAPVVEVSDKLELSPESFLVVKNHRDVSVFVELVFADLFSGSNVIEKENIVAEKSSFTVEPNEEKKVKISLTNVVAPPGKYRSLLRVKIG